MDINRKTAYLILDDIEKDGAFSNLAINAREKECKPTSPAFVRELVYGVLRYKMQLDHIWGQLMDHKGRVKRGDKILLRMGLRSNPMEIEIESGSVYSTFRFVSQSVMEKERKKNAVY